jgi:hypothetical protein
VDLPDVAAAGQLDRGELLGGRVEPDQPVRAESR